MNIMNNHNIHVATALHTYSTTTLISVTKLAYLIREYGSTLYVGMAPKKNGHPYISIASDELKSLVIYTDRL